MIGKFIKEARKAKGLTQDELGKAIGLTGVAIMRYEKNQREPSKEIIERMAEVLNVHPNDLIGWKIVNEFKTFEAFINYLKSLGYSIFIHQVSETTYTAELQKNGIKSIFTQDEFENLQNNSQETLEGLILLQSQKKKESSIDNS